MPLAVFLNSGGKDSLATAILMHRYGWELHSVFCDFGQAPADPSEKSARAIAEKYAVSHETLKIPGEWVALNKMGFVAVPYVNLTVGVIGLLRCAYFKAERMVSGTRIDTVGTEFPRLFQALVDQTKQRKNPMIEYPVFEKTDEEIYEIVKDEPLWRGTVTCPSHPPCGSCKRCLLRSEWLTR